jgi:hypothetical protein
VGEAQQCPGCGVPFHLEHGTDCIYHRVQALKVVYRGAV